MTPSVFERMTVSPLTFGIIGRPVIQQSLDAAPLSSLKKAEGFQLALDSSETLTLRRGLHELARLQHEQDIPQGHAEFVKAESHFAPLLDLSPADLNRFFRPWRNHG